MSEVIDLCLVGVTCDSPAPQVVVGSESGWKQCKRAVMCLLAAVESETHPTRFITDAVPCLMHINVEISIRWCLPVQERKGFCVSAATAAESGLRFQANSGKALYSLENVLFRLIFVSHL